MVNTLKGKISWIYFCLVILIAIVGTVSFLNLYQLSKAIDGLMIDNYKSINAVNNMLEAIERQDSAVLIYVTVDHQKGIDLFSENNNTFMKWYNVEYNNVTEKGEKEIVESINSNYSKYVKEFSELQEIRNTDGDNKSIDFYNTTMLLDFNNLKKQLKDLTALNEKAMFTEKDRATSNARHSTTIIFSLTAFSIIVGFVLSKYFTNHIFKPMYRLIAAIKEIKAGNLGHQAEILSNDEVGELAKEFNNMTYRLLQYEQSTLGEILKEKNKSLAIVKSIYDPLIVLDTNFRILLLNDASESFFNIKEEKVLDRHFLEGIRNGELFDFIATAFESKGDTIQKIICLSTEMEERYFNVMVTGIKDNSASIVGLVILLQNVTQLKQLEKIRTDFIATISHEIKTPLTSIMMGTNLVLGELIGSINDEQKEVVTAIKEDGERLSILANDLLELNRIESGKAVYQIETCSIGNIIESSTKQFYKQAEQKNVSLITHFERDLPLIKADYEKITWVLNNLISNALKYTDSGDKILVSASLKNNKMLVSVKDTGVGIPEEYLNKIFDKFVQVKGGDFEVRGTGLGLAVVKEIIEAHEGKIWCVSELDSGSCFTFELNLA